MAQFFADLIHLRAKPDWKAATWAGIIAGAIFLIFEMVLVAAVSGSPWGPPRMMAAIILGKGVLPPPATFDFGIVVAAMLVHFVLSVVLALGFAAVATRLTMGNAIIAGAVFGLAVYVINFYGFTAVFPWFAMARNWISILGHALFGVVLAWAYKHLETSPSAGR
jgi:uncharacterized membrane protein YagU involved in acid resistance